MACITAFKRIFFPSCENRVGSHDCNRVHILCFIDLNKTFLYSSAIIGNFKYVSIPSVVCILRETINTSRISSIVLGEKYIIYLLKSMLNSFFPVYIRMIAFNINQIRCIYLKRILLVLSIPNIVEIYS